MVLPDKTSTSKLSFRLAIPEQYSAIREMVNLAYRKEGHAFKLGEERKRTSDSEVQQLIQSTHHDSEKCAGIVCFYRDETELIGSIFLEFTTHDLDGSGTLYFGMLAKSENIERGTMFKWGQDGEERGFAPMIIETLMKIGKVGGCKTVSCVVFHVSTALVKHYMTNCQLVEYGRDEVPFKHELCKEVEFIKLHRFIEE
ncbi:predicted protein [Naegleria gruberi]|uniref:Predicted protein n=1 Tax=Naegleria gruberi TaxID=5762 RepID=D2V4A6_NAEGR|nr:uncharacterized protein NAEGRDRAFT_46580 [Naegleria gruberi]EFC48483.1 predicted protein [Naegleria gruberi]|eukprot:XP_002681227.1 predicted protein [Naegleria gruberi strain NEG-M]